MIVDVGPHAEPVDVTSQVLEVTGLTLDLRGQTEQDGLVEDVTFSVQRGETVALIGESGCGKTMTALAILGLLPDSVRVAAGSVVIGGRDLLGSPAQAADEARGSLIGTIFQDPMSSLNPTMTVGNQIAESRRIHLKEPKKVALRHAAELLDLVGIPNPQTRLNQFPHQFSGGMQQRAMIAAAIACEPKLLIADEPTTALDVTIQAEVLELMSRLQEQSDLGIILVTHDLGVVADVADQVVVMYAGHVVERTDVFRLFESPSHPYTAALLDSIPQSGRPHLPLEVIPGRVPPAGSFPRGCRFHPRCSYALEGTCTGDTIPLTAIAASHDTRCVRTADGSVQLRRRND